MSVASETTGARRPAREQEPGFWRSPLGRLTKRVPFYMLVALIFVYCALPVLLGPALRLHARGRSLLDPAAVRPGPPDARQLPAGVRSRVLPEGTPQLGDRRGWVTLLSLAIGTLAAFALGRFQLPRTVVRHVPDALDDDVPVDRDPRRALHDDLRLRPRSDRSPELYDTLWALLFTYLIFTLPFTIWVLTSFMQALPGDLEEAAYVDGATPFQVFYKVLLPLLAPGPRHDRAARVHRRLERVPLRALVHPGPGQVHRPDSRSRRSSASRAARSSNPGARSWPRRSSSPCRSSRSCWSSSATSWPASPPEP